MPLEDLSLGFEKTEILRGYPALTLENFEKQAFLLSCCEREFNSWDQVESLMKEDKKAILLSENLTSYIESFANWTENRPGRPERLQLDIFQRLQTMWKTQCSFLENKKNRSPEETNLFQRISKVFWFSPVFFCYLQINAPPMKCTTTV